MVANVTLNTTPTHEGIKLTFDDGRDAGIILVDVSPETGPLYQFQRPTIDLIDPNTFGCPGRRNREAAEYDALAWASDQDVPPNH